jgi:hypothetical protein
LDPQGSPLQRKEKLIESIKLKLADAQFTIWDITDFMNEIMTEITNILQKQISLKESLEMEVVHNTGLLIRNACRSAIDDRQSNDEVHTAALDIQFKLVQIGNEIDKL